MYLALLKTRIRGVEMRSDPFKNYDSWKTTDPREAYSDALESFIENKIDGRIGDLLADDDFIVDFMDREPELAHEIIKDVINNRTIQDFAIRSKAREYAREKAEEQLTNEFEER